MHSFNLSLSSKTDKKQSRAANYNETSWLCKTQKQAINDDGPEIDDLDECPIKRLLIFKNEHNFRFGKSRENLLTGENFALYLSQYLSNLILGATLK